MSRIIVSCSLTQDQKDYLDGNRLSPTSVLQEAIEKRMTGVYDADREGLMDDLFDQFFKDGRGRSFRQCKDWLESPAWREDLRASGLTALGFMSICRKRVEAMGENGVDPVMQYMVGLIDEVPPSAVHMPGLSPARRRYIQEQKKLAQQWEIDQRELEAVVDDEDPN